MLAKYEIDHSPLLLGLFRRIPDFVDIVQEEKLVQYIRPVGIGQHFLVQVRLVDQFFVGLLLLRRRIRPRFLGLHHLLHQLLVGFHPQRIAVLADLPIGVGLGVLELQARGREDLAVHLLAQRRLHLLRVQPVHLGDVEILGEALVRRPGLRVVAVVHRELANVLLDLLELLLGAAVLRRVLAPLVRRGAVVALDPAPVQHALDEGLGLAEGEAKALLADGYPTVLGAEVVVDRVLADLLVVAAARALLVVYVDEVEEKLKPVLVRADAPVRVEDALLLLVGDFAPAIVAALLQRFQGPLVDELAGLGHVGLAGVSLGLPAFSAVLDERQGLCGEFRDLGIFVDNFRGDSC